MVPGFWDAFPSLGFYGSSPSELTLTLISSVAILAFKCALSSNAYLCGLCAFPSVSAGD